MFSVRHVLGKVPDGLFLIFLKDFDFVTQSVVFFLKNLEFFSLFFRLHYSTYLFFCCLNYKFRSRSLQEQRQEQGCEESQQHGNSISQVRKSTRHHSGRNNRRKDSTSPGKEAGGLEWGCDFISESMVLCRY